MAAIALPHMFFGATAVKAAVAMQRSPQQYKS
jgi:hypothetical protein